MIVGIGASAGGLAAFESFFRQMPPTSGMAFVIVQHLDPSRPSMLTDLLTKYTRMPVAQVTDGMVAQPNHVYVIPPNSELSLAQGALHLASPLKPRGRRLPIDDFFRSLATDQGERAIGIVLSGTGSDGTLGLRAIKEEGGLTIVQTPESAAYDGMPQSALQNGLADVLLPPEQMAEHLIDYAENAFGSDSELATLLKPGITEHMHSMLLHVRRHTGHDFGGYKKNTIARRIERRIVASQLANAKDYLRSLESTPHEVDALFRELLIGVTGFFRDAEAFALLEREVLVPLLERRSKSPRRVRIWIPGCSTGEEAYSIAILLYEHMERLHVNVEVQIFATDISAAAIEKARNARYPESIAADVSPDRLERFFTKEEGTNLYHVEQKIRDMIVFAVQSVTRDPPFSKLDLICCRNLLIYLGAELQNKLASLFHYSLSPSGYLFLGSSESLGSTQRLFRSINNKWKIFQRLEVTNGPRTLLSLPAARSEKSSPAHAQSDEPHTSLRGLTEQMILTEYAPTSVVVNEKGDMLYVHGRTGKYLEQTTGEASTNILHVARHGLRVPLTTVIRKVNSTMKPAHLEDIPVGTGEDRLRIRLDARPFLKPPSMQGLVLLVFREQVASPEPHVDPASAQESGRARRANELRHELRTTREHLQSTIEELETTNEELKSANDALQTSNEDVQSTNEELQTSKEELQSMNEELLTVNTELQNTVLGLTEANNDIKNLLDNTQVGIIFLDLQLRIRRYTQSINPVVDLIPSDTGRPLAQLVHKLHPDRLLKDAREVLKTETPHQGEVRTADGRWHLMRILPYRTLANEVEGVVITFTDVTDLKEAAEALQASEAKLLSILESSDDIIGLRDREGKLLYFNTAFKTAIKQRFNVDIAIGDNTLSLLPKDYRAHFKELWGRVLGGERHRGEYTQETAGQTRYYDLSLNPIVRQSEVIGFVEMTRNITVRRQAEEDLRASENKLRTILDTLVSGVVVVNVEGTIVYANRGAESILGVSRDAIHGRYYQSREWQQMDDKGRPYPQDKLPLAVALSERRSVDSIEHQIVALDGERKWLSVNAAPLFDTNGHLAGAVGGFQDITARREAEAALHASQARIQAVMDSMSAGAQIIDKSFRYMYLNDAVVSQSRYASRDELLGRTMMEKYPGIEHTDLFQHLRRCMEHRVSEHVENELTFPDGSTGWLDLSIQPVEDGIFILSEDVTLRKRAEEELKAALGEKEILLRELSHRTKNNMQVIRSMLALHAAVTKNDEVRRVFAEVENKIFAMALVHKKLYQSHSLFHIDAKEYIEELTNALSESYGDTIGRVAISVHAEPMPVSIDTAVPCGLVITELVLNAFKHAFPGDRRGTITIHLSKSSEGAIALSIADDGVGVPANFDFRNQPSLGLRTAHMIVEHQHRGSIRFVSNGGLRCDIEIPQTEGEQGAGE